MHTTHDYAQSSPEWDEARAKSNNASELLVAMGMSKKTTRTDMVRIVATGDEKQYSQWVEEVLFPKGHHFERLARPIAEKIIGEDLYPACVSIHVDGLTRPLAASLDGSTMDESTNWEHKTLNAELAEAMDAGMIPEEYWPQMEQGMLINGATRCLFMASKWDDDDQLIEEKHLWYVSQPSICNMVVPVWAQFEADVAEYRHVEVLPPPVAAPIEDLPALMVEISGRVVASNLTQWHDIVAARIKGINTTLQTDNDFATAEKTVKFLEDGEKRIALIKAQAQAQATDIDAVFRAMDNIAAEMRAKRLELDKLVKARKESIRGEIMQEGKDKLAEHLATLNKRLGRVQLPPLPVDFAGAMKGKKTMASLRDAVNTELARAKIDASAMADGIDANLKTLEQHTEYAFLFADLARICTKPADDFALLVKSRIDTHKAEEARKEEELRERIRIEEEARAAAKMKAEQEAAAFAEASRAAQQSNTTAKPVASVTATNDGTGETPALGQRETPQQDNGAVLKLGDINTLLGFVVSSEFLASLGFNPVRVERFARLYSQAEFPKICLALASHIQSVGSSFQTTMQQEA